MLSQVRREPRKYAVGSLDSKPIEIRRLTPALRYARGKWTQQRPALGPSKTAYLTDCGHSRELMNGRCERMVRVRTRFIEDSVDRARFDPGKLFRIEPPPSRSGAWSLP